uniref:Uncharacterized protein n=1 Tax=Acrobeloides nanus TaxID=290746 RepID=A0A914EM69_9BILA
MNFDPWYGEKNLEGNPEYHDAQLLHINSFFTVPILAGCYAILCIVTTVNAFIFKHSIMTNLQRVMLYQSMCICVEIFITATVYVGNATGILAIPEMLAPVEHATWILVHADTPIVYLIFNRSLRKAAFEWTNNHLLKRNRNRIHNFITTHMM